MRRTENVMAEVTDWHLRGGWFDVCSCNLPCPCTFAQPPDNDECRFVFVWKLHEGNFGDVDLSGLGVIALGEFEGNAWGGGPPTLDLLLCLDDAAGQEQREALTQIFTGQVGGWPATFATLVRELRGIEQAPITWDAPDDLSYWRAGIPGKIDLYAQALTGPTSDPDKRVQLLNSPGSEVGPGQVATWGVVSNAAVNGFDFFSKQYEGTSTKHFPFDWRPERATQTA